MEDKIVGVLIGLVGACNNNPKTGNTDRLVIKALACPSEPRAIEEMIAELRAEKNLISPGCAVCTAPCGNTSDYDMGRLDGAEAEIRKAKLCILSELREAASYISEHDVPLADVEIELFYKALAYVSYNLKKEALLVLSDEIREMIQKIKETNS